MSEIIRQTDRPVDLFAQLRTEMDNMFRNWWGRPALPTAFANWPALSQPFTACELQETDGEYVVKFDVPGMSEKDIKVNMHGDQLTVHGERKEQKTEGKGATRYTERSYGAFTRTVTMPTEIKADEIRARYKDGVMEVHLPKAQKTATREIKVEAGT